MEILPPIKTTIISPTNKAGASPQLKINITMPNPIIEQLARIIGARIIDPIKHSLFITEYHPHLSVA